MAKNVAMKFILEIVKLTKSMNENPAIQYLDGFLLGIQFGPTQVDAPD